MRTQLLAATALLGALSLAACTQETKTTETATPPPADTNITVTPPDVTVTPPDVTVTTPEPEGVTTKETTTTTVPGVGSTTTTTTEKH
jgi:PBP1b-binding outer membrane lipoprotein LpoB